MLFSDIFVLQTKKQYFSIVDFKAYIFEYFYYYIYVKVFSNLYIVLNFLSVQPTSEHFRENSAKSVEKHFSIEYLRVS